MSQHVKVLGYLYIITSALGVLAAIILAVMFGGVAGILQSTGEADALKAIPIVGIVFLGIGAFIVLLSIPGLVAGYGLLQLRSWARILALILGALNLLNFPIGTALGAYTFGVLLSRESDALFQSPRMTARPW